MGGNGKLRRWRFPLRRSKKKEPPPEFICLISNSLMFNPAVVSSGHTLERLCVDVCRDLAFTPTLPDGSKPDFSTVIPNLALKTAILNWCSSSGADHPRPPVYSEIESIIRSLSETLETPKDKPPILFSDAVTELNRDSSSSSEESVIANTTPFLPFATRPSCFSYSSSPSTSSEFISEERSSNVVSISSSSEDDNLIAKMTSLDVYEQEQAVIQLRKTTRTSEEARTSLCSEQLLLALKRLLDSRYAAVQTNATAALVNLSLEKGNKVKIVRAGVVPVLINILKSGYDESREHAAGAIFSLALEDDNKTAIGVLGALPPLLHELRSGTRRSRHDAALALYHLTLVQINRAKVIRLGAAGALLGLLKDADVTARVVLVVCNLAACGEGRAALLDANAVDCLAGLLRNRAEFNSESTRENCVAALHSLSDRSLRFKGLARDAGVADVLRDVVKTDNERAREKARRILEGLREHEEAENENEDVDWEAVMKGGVTRARYRVGKCNSVEF